MKKILALLIALALVLGLCACTPIISDGKTTLAELWTTIGGAYADIDEDSDYYGNFALIMKDGDDFVYSLGLLNSGYAEGGAVSNFVADSDTYFTMDINVPAVEANEMDDGRPASTIALTIDTSGAKDTIKVTYAFANGITENYTLTKYGNTLDEVYAAISASYPTLAELWATIGGAYADIGETSSNYGYFAMLTTDADKYMYTLGILNSSYAEGGTVSNFVAVSETYFTMDINVPAVEANDMDDARPASTIALTIDISGAEDTISVTYSFENGNTENVTLTRYGDEFDDLTAAIMATYPTLAELWATIAGAYAHLNEDSDNYGKFALIATDADKYMYTLGILNSGYAEGGTVSDFVAGSDTYFTMKINVPAVEANEMDDGRPASTITLNISITSKDTIMVEYYFENGNYETYTLTKYGNSLDDIYDRMY